MDAAICVFGAVNLSLQCRINPAAYLPENVNRYFHFPRVLKIICMQAVLVASLLYSLARILLFSLLQTPFMIYLLKCIECVFFFYFLVVHTLLNSISIWIFVLHGHNLFSFYELFLTWTLSCISVFVCQCMRVCMFHSILLLIATENNQHLNPHSDGGKCVHAFYFMLMEKKEIISTIFETSNNFEAWK